MDHHYSLGELGKICEAFVLSREPLNPRFVGRVAGRLTKEADSTTLETDDRIGYLLDVIRWNTSQMGTISAELLNLQPKFLDRIQQY